MKEKRDINKEMETLIKQYKSSTSVEQEYIFKEMCVLNKPVIYYTINLMKFKPPITKQELEQECLIKFWEIIKGYAKNDDLTTEQFTNYLIRNLKLMMINYIRETQGTIKVPHWIQAKNADINAFIGITGEEPTEEQLKNQGFTDEEIENYNKTNHLNNFDEFEEDKIGGHNDNYNFIDEIYNNEKLYNVFNSLDDIEKEYIKKIVFEEKSYAEAGRELGRTRESVRTRYNRIIKKLKNQLA